MNALQSRANRQGFTLTELVVVVMIIGVTTAFALPRMVNVARHESVRGARREVTTQLARAKSLAAQRSCRTALQMRAGPPAKVWVEACKVTGAGRDTVGFITNMATKYSVTMTTSADSIPFAPTTLGVAPAAIAMTFARSGYTLNLAISSTGKPTW